MVVEGIEEVIKMRVSKQTMIPQGIMESMSIL